MGYIHSNYNICENIGAAVKKGLTMTPEAVKGLYDDTKDFPN